MRKGLRRAITIAIAIAACSGVEAFAQGDPRGSQVDLRGAFGVFGGATVGGAAAAQSTANGPDASLMVKVGQAYDQDLVADVNGTSTSLFAGSGFYTTITPQLQFQSGQGRVRLFVTAASDGRYYSDLERFFVTTHSGDVGVTAQLTPRTSVSFNEAVTYSSALFSGLLPSSVAAPSTAVATAGAASSYPLDNNPSYSYASTVGVTEKLSDRATVALTSGAHYTDFTNNTPGYSDVHFADAGAQFSYGLSRGVRLRLGYTFTKGQYAGSPNSTDQHLDIGIDYTRPISRTRKTTVSFTLGPGVVNGALATDRPEDVRRQYRLIGDVFLTHQIGRTWSIQASGRRGLGFIQGFQSPVFSTSYAVSASGFLTRRIDLSTSVGFSSGEPALNGSPSQFTSYTADVQTRFALNHHLATYVEYLLYDYRFDQGFQLSPLVPPQLVRNGLRLGLMTWIPMRHR